MRELSDQELLEAVGRDRDQAAFGELVKRFERAALGLAYRITGHRNMAEEAVQEALLRIWLAAPSYQPEGKASAWILRIVARESLMILRSARRSARRSERLQRGTSMSKADRELPDAAAALEGRELATACKNFFEKLPFGDQQLVALHYLGGLSQEEISRELSIPQRTISHRIQKILETLRLNLTQAGMAASAPLLGAEELNHTLCEELIVPPGLREKVMGKVAAAARGNLPSAASHSRRAAAASAGSSTLLWSGLVVAAMAMGALWWSAGTKPQVPPSPSPAPVEAPKAMLAQPLPAPVVPPPAPVAATTAPKLEPFLRRWDFNSPEQAKDFVEDEGSWHFVAGGGVDGSGCMESDGDRLFRHLDVSAAKLPLRVSFHAQIIHPEPPGLYYSGVAWGNCRWEGMFRNLGKLHKVGSEKQWSEIRIYLGPAFSDHWIENQRSKLSVHELKDHAKLYLILRGRHRIDNFTVQEIRKNELPDVREYLAALEKIEPAKRVGRVVLPELKSQRPPDPVCIDFNVQADAPESKQP